MRRVTCLLSTAALVVGVSGIVFTPAVSAAPVAGTDTAQPASVPDELLVGYDAGTSANDRAAARSRAGSRLVSVVVPESPGRAVVELVATPAGGRGQSERRFEADPKVSYAEPNWIYQHAATSNDPSYTNGNLWGMYGDATAPTNPYGSQAGEAWAAGNTGSNDVYVGVIDEGIQIDHPDLADNIWTNPKDPADGVDNDGNGYVDDVNGWDFDGNDNSVYDGAGDDHGTHVAGTIGAKGGDARGVAGVAWDVKLIPIKFLGADGGTTANATLAVDYLTDLKTKRGLNVVASNNSWGGGGSSEALRAAIERANAAGILFIAAAGNSGVNADRRPHYPASYTNTNIISVAALDEYGAKASFSNYGASSVDLGAPGVGILSTVPGGGYASYNGTSMATPHVAGAAALYAAANDGASAAAIQNAILSSAIPTASMNGKTVTGGRLDAGGFVPTSTIDAPPAAPGTPTATAGDGVVQLAWPDNTETDLAGYQVWRAVGGAVESITPTLLTVPAYDDADVVNGTAYTYYVVAVDDAGQVSPHSPTATATPTAATSSTQITLSAVGSKVKGLQQVQLTWSGDDRSATVTVRRTGTSAKTIESLPNRGDYLDKIAVKGSGTYSYEVCQSTCSNKITVVF